MDHLRRSPCDSGDHPAPTPAAGGDLLGSEWLGSAQSSRIELLARIAVLEGRLMSLPAIEQAKGALMLAYGLSADAAFAVLRFHSQHRNVKIRAIAAQLTNLMATSPSSVEAIGRFQRLLDQVAQQPSAPAVTGEETRASSSRPPTPLGPE